MIRLFAAIPLPEAVRQRLTIIQSGLPGCRWTLPENFHLTVRFFGEVDEPTAAEIDHALASLSFEPFELNIAHVGYFGTQKKPRLVWAGVQPNPALDYIHTKVDRTVVKLGLSPDDRRYTPHVTLGRLRDTSMDRLRQWLAASDDVRIGPIWVDRITLFESHRHAGGPTYLPLADYPLGHGMPAETPLPAAASFAL